VTLDDVVRLPAPDAAPALLGWTFLVDGVGGVIVETEAYTEDDPASHSYRGRTARTGVMFGPPGHLYVYRSYGIHWCANIVCDADGTGAAVLLRALEPTQGLDAMRARRGVDDVRKLCSGPGRLTQALGITSAHDGAAIGMPPFALHPPTTRAPYTTTPRIGITKAVDLHRRYVADRAGRTGPAPTSGRRRA
jgi:DNA-3-methyladenine glycosylase